MKKLSTLLFLAVFCVVSGNLASASDLYWSGAGNWDTGTQNWGTASGGPYDAAVWDNSIPDYAIFEGTGGAVTLDEPITADGLTFNAGGYSLSGDTLTLSGGAVVDSVHNAEINNVITGSNGLLATGVGALYLYGENTYTGDTTISQGRIMQRSVSAVGTGTVTLGDADTGALNVFFDTVGYAMANNVVVSNQGSGLAIISISTSPVAGTTITLNRDAQLDTAQLTGTSNLSELIGTGNLTITGSNGQRLVSDDVGGTMYMPNYTGNITVQSGGIYEPRGSLTATTGNDITIESAAELRMEYSSVASVGPTVIGGLHGGGKVGSAVSWSSHDLELHVGKGDADGDFSGSILAGSRMSLVKIGEGTQILSDYNEIDRGTIVEGGTLIVNGSVRGEVQAQSGTTVGGIGTIDGGLTMNAGSTLAPGASPGEMTVGGDLTLAGANLEVDIWGDAGAGLEGGHDLISLTAGTLALSGSPTITVNLNGFDPSLDNSYTIISGEGTGWSVDDWGAISVENAPASWADANKSFAVSEGSVMLTVIPEPATGVLFAALGGIIFCIRRRFRV